MRRNSEKEIKVFYDDISEISKKIDKKEIYKLIKSIKKIKLNNGRIFFVGVGGSAANCSHAVNDFRKLCNIESYSCADNISELTARINDEGWNSSFSDWLKVSNISSKDAIFVLSVGGGNIKKKVSTNIVEAIKYAKKRKARIFGIVGRDGGFTKKYGDNIILIPNINKKYVTPYTEAYQAVVWHGIVSHSLLQMKSTKW